MNDFSLVVSIVVSILFAVVLPITIVFITMRQKIKKDNNRKDIILAALDKNPDVDIEELTRKLDKPEDTKDKLAKSFSEGIMVLMIGAALFLLQFIPGVRIPFASVGGVIMMAIGIAKIAAFFVSKRLYDNGNNNHPSESK